MKKKKDSRYLARVCIHAFQPGKREFAIKTNKPTPNGTQKRKKPKEISRRGEEKRILLRVTLKGKEDGSPEQKKK